MATATQVIARATSIANDNQFRYYDASNNETNGLGAITVPYTMDCATFLCYAIYLAEGWAWYNQPYGYFWPHVSQSGFDAFLTNTMNLTKISYSSGMTLQTGDIVITNETMHHAFMYIGTNSIIDANNYFGYADNSIAVRALNVYSESDFEFVYRWSSNPLTQMFYYRKRRRRAFI